MRKKIFGKQLSRNRKSRGALFQSLVKALVLNGQIQTTKVKAKAIQGSVDKLFTIAKKNTLQSRRLLLSKLRNDEETVQKMISVYTPLFQGRSSGFTRAVNLPKRTGDRAEIVRLEFVEKVGLKEKDGDKPQGKSE